MANDQQHLSNTQNVYSVARNIYNNPKAIRKESTKPPQLTYNLKSRNNINYLRRYMSQEKREGVQPGE